MTAPIVKWVGGKTRLLPELVKRMPAQYRTYYEPFLGGGALFFHLCPPRAIVSDANLDLFELYLGVRSDVEKVIRTLSQMARHHNRRYYERIKAEWNQFGTRGRMSTARRAATFLYLNRTCFNGLWRVNSKGEFNVPMGDYGAGHICDAGKLRAAARVLDSAVVRFGDYWKNCSGAGGGDFVYFDPPYDPVSPSASFTGYTSNGFGRDEQETLAANAAVLVENGAQVMLSNSDTRFIRKIYRARGFKIYKVTAPRSINSNVKKRGRVGELIITGGY